MALFKVKNLKRIMLFGSRNHNFSPNKKNYAISEKEVGCDNVDKPDKGDRGGRVTRLTGFTERWAALHCTWIIWTVLGYFRL